MAAQTSTPPPTQRTALIVGASGLVGSVCLQHLLASEHYKTVVAWTRRPLSLEHPRLRCEVVDFDHLPQENRLPKVDDVFCALGAPMGALWNRPLVRKVDYHYPLGVAKWALSRGAERLFVVTSAGIGHRSPLHYCRVKARTEDDLASLGFGAVHIFRPSVLIGHNLKRTPFQGVMGWLLRPLAALFRGRLGVFKPVSGAAVGYAMSAVAATDHRGLRTWPSHVMDQLYRQQTVPHEPPASHPSDPINEEVPS